jgi:pimeloyl-ACP methyl ester carboxylesterase
MTLGMREDRASFFADFFPTFFGEGVLKSPVSSEVIEWARGLAMMASLKATLACAFAFATTDFRKDLAAFRMPTLIIHGTADKTVPIDTSGRAAAKAIAGSRLIEYDGAPHGIFASHKERLSRDLLEFLTA